MLCIWTYSCLFLNKVVVLEQKSTTYDMIKCLLWPGASQWRIYFHSMGGVNICVVSNYGSSPMGNSWLQSTTTSYWQCIRDSRSHWSHPPTLMGSTPWAPRMYGVNVGNKSQDLLQQPGLEHASTLMKGQLTACAATQGIYNYKIYTRNKKSQNSLHNLLKSWWDFFWINILGGLWMLGWKLSKKFAVFRVQSCLFEGT